MEISQLEKLRDQVCVSLTSQPVSLEKQTIIDALIQIPIRDGLLRFLFDHPEHRNIVSENLETLLEICVEHERAALATILAGNFWLDSDLSPLMVHENYIANTMKSKIETEENKLQNLDNLFAAASCLSNIDLFESDIEATNWELMPYIAVNCISASANCHTRAQIKFPTFLAKTSTKGKNKRIIQELSVKFGQYRISNSTFKLEYLNYILITLFESLFNDKTKGKITKFVVKCLDFGFTKEDIQENIFNLIISCEDYNKYNYKSIETKTKNAIVKGFATIE